MGSQSLDIGTFTNAIRETWNVDGPGPMRDSLAAAIRRCVEGGRIPPDGRLPAERLLARRLGVSRTTVVAAYGELVRSGLLRRRTGSGTFVTPARAGGAAVSRLLAVPFLGKPDLAPEQTRLDFRTAAGEADESVVPAFQAAMEELPRVVATHGYVQLGWAPLRGAIADHLTARGMPTAPDQVLVTGGAQPAIDLVFGATLDPGDRVVVENPTYPGALEALRRANAAPLAVPAGIAGVRSDQLREVAVRAGARLVYLQPTFSNPTGAVVPAPERQRLAGLAQELDLTIVEDLTTADLAIAEGAPPPPVASYGETGRVLTIGSFSKLFWGGLRLGWIRGSPSQISRLAMVKATVDLSTALPVQMAGARLVPATAEAVERRRRQLGTRLSVMEELLATLLPAWRWVSPAGGLVLWVRLPVADAEPLTRLARDRGIEVAPGARFTVDDSGAPYVRLPFCRPPEVLEAGVQRLARAWADLEEAPTASGALSAPLV
jgi:DNA-binding transcriptional MocR family regulator